MIYLTTKPSAYRQLRVAGYMGLIPYPWSGEQWVAALKAGDVDPLCVHCDLPVEICMCSPPTDQRRYDSRVAVALPAGSYRIIPAMAGGQSNRAAFGHGKIKVTDPLAARLCKLALDKEHCLAVYLVEDLLKYAKQKAFLEGNPRGAGKTTATIKIVDTNPQPVNGRLVLGREQP